ncbi:helix-turn-helix domain-containing protein [Nocardia sp. NPDC003999]
MTTVDTVAELQLYSLADTAKMLRVSEDWLTKRVRARKIPARRTGRKWSFSAEDIRAAHEFLAVPAGDSRDGAK